MVVRMRLVEQQAMFSHDVANLILYIYEQGFNCTLGEAHRTSEQAQWYAMRGIGIKNSLHCQRLAIDINLFSPSWDYLTKYEEYEPFGRYWESLDPLNRWGGNFKIVDANHFERNTPL